MAISQGRDKCHANFLVLVVRKWDKDFQGVGVLFDRVKRQDCFASDFGTCFALEHLAEFGDPVVLFLRVHRGELGPQETKFIDAFGEDHDFFAVLFPLALDVGIEFFHLEERAIDAT